MVEFDINRPKNSITAPHPLSVRQETYLHKQQVQRKQMLANMYGIHAAFRQDMDEFVLRKCKSGVNSRGIPFGLDVLLGRDQTIEPFEYLHGIDPNQRTFKVNRY